MNEISTYFKEKIFNLSFENQNRIAILALLVLSLIAFFLHLNSFPVLVWDESRIAVNAFEMSKNHNFIVTYFEGRPDLWNTKPPLLVWLVVLCMKLFGYTEFALRLPSALSGLLTTFLIYFFVKKEFKSPLAGFCCALVLITSIGYIGEHVCRTGDYDALLTLFITSYMLAFYKFIYDENEKRKDAFFMIFTASIILALLTKSVAGLLMIPGPLLFLVTEGKIKTLFNRRTLYAVLIFVLLVPGYYFLREHFNPGYIKAFLENDFGRLSSTLENHLHPFNYYWENIFNERLIPWVYFLFFALITTLVNNNEKIKKLSLYTFVCGLSYFLIISYSKTKLTWYDAPLFPIVAIVIGLGIYAIYNHINYQSLRYKNKILFTSLFICSIFFLPYKKMVDYAIAEPLGAQWVQVFYSDFMKQLYKEHKELNRYKIINIEYNAHLTFYCNVFKEKGVFAKVLNMQDQILPGDTVMACREDVKMNVEKKFLYQELVSFNTCKLYLIKSLNNDYWVKKVHEIILNIENSPEWYNNSKARAKMLKITMNEQLFNDAMYVLDQTHELTEVEKGQIKRYFLND